MPPIYQYVGWNRLGYPSKRFTVFETWDSITESLNNSIEICIPKIKHTSMESISN